MKLICYSWLFILLLNANSFATIPPSIRDRFKLLPQPQKIEWLSGTGLLYRDLQGVFIKDINTKPLMTGILANLPSKAFNAAGTVSLVISKQLSLPSREGYVMKISDKKVLIEASERVGLFYGLQTLSQLLEDAQDQQIEIPACRITDYPEIAYRAVHLDLKHHLDAGHYYYDMIDRLAGIKINAIIVEFEDKLGYRKSPLVAGPNAISIEEFAAISKYAQERFIEISPLVQGLGHASFILKHEAYKSLRDNLSSDWVFDPMNPATYYLQFSLYEDAIAATPYGKYLHVGGDEVGELGMSALSKASGLQPLELQLYWLKKVTDFAKQHNRIPIFWDDMILKLANLYETTYDATIPAIEVKQRWDKNAPLLVKTLPLFPKECVYMRWNYDESKITGNQLAIDWYKANNLSVMAATCATLYSTMFPRTKHQFQPIKDFCQLTAEKKMNGILCTVWDDASPHLETIWRGLYNFALFSWNYEDISMDLAHATFRQRFYSTALAPASFNFQDLLEEATPFWETALLQQGDRENYPKNFTLIDLPHAEMSGTWSKNYHEKLSRASTGIFQHTTIDRQIKMAQKLTRRNQYALSLFDVINELQMYSCQLLLLLKQYDQAAKAAKHEKAVLIKKQVEKFAVIRTRLEATYSKTRIMGNPEGYQLDSNFHKHLANGTNNTDWMFVYEIAMNQQINEWLLQVSSIK